MSGIWIVRPELKNKQTSSNMNGIPTNLDDDPENQIRILVATDNHLGYEEKDQIRGNDSYVAFDEILQHATTNDVDFILLGGDLFHHANPTTNTLNRCLNLLRKHTLGDNPISFQILSDQNVNFYHSVNRTVNYEDPNINVGIPVFSIHGNHDDPSGFARLSALDVLSTSGLINYFGKWVDLTKIDLQPIMIKKGETKLNIYGLSYIHDPRLYRLFKEHKVTMQRPEEDPDSWFNLMVVHQNREDRGPKNYLPETVLPDFLDAIIWGHEHDCRIVPESNPAKQFSIIQPGSSVATSLSEGESIDKHCGLLVINRKHFKMCPIKLETVRPFVFRALNLSDHAKEIEEGDSDINHNVQEFVRNIVEEMILEAHKKLTGHPQQPTLPLLRLRLDFGDESQMFNAIRFGQQYADRVANNKDMLQFRKIKKRVKNDASNFDKAAFNDLYEKELEEKQEIRVEDIVNRYFDEVDSNKKLKVFSTEGLAELCRRLVMHEDEDAANQIIDFYKVHLCRHLKQEMPDEDGIADEIRNFKETKADDLVKPMLEMLDQRGGKAIKTSESILENYESDRSAKPTTKAATTSRAGRQTKLTAANIISLDDEDDDMPLAKPTKPARGRGSRGGRAARGAGTSRAAKPELNISVTRASTSTTQLSIQKSFSQTSLRKPKGKIHYVDDSD